MTKQISISQVLTDLENGVTRAEIGTKYDITAREVKALFEHPKLKGKKAKKTLKLTFDIVDDTPDTLWVNEPVVEPATVDAPQSEDKKDWK